MAARALALALAFLVLAAGLPRAAAAVDPYELDVILSLTGTGTFIGTEQWQAIQSIETLVNEHGGIKGRPVKFASFDDQSNPQVAVVLTRTLIEKHVPVILGPSLAASCNAMTPLVQATGPVVYCLTNAGRPAPGGYVFSTLFSTKDMLSVGIRFFRERGWRRIAYIVSSDASGQDAEQGILDAAALPENKPIELVAREHFATTDINVGAQMARIKAANPDAIIAWAAGSPAGTLFHGLADAGLAAPTMTSPGNLNFAFFKQYAQLLPKDLYFSAIPYYAADDVTDRATKSALSLFVDALGRVNKKPDQIFVSSWDPAMLVVDALRHLGADASPAALRDYLVRLRGWTGVNGQYDFRAHPQRGIGEDSIVIVRWDAGKGAWTTASKFGGAPRT